MALTQPVRVWSRTRTGEDPMGDPTWAWEPFDVDGVLVRVGRPADPEGSGVVGGLRPDATEVAFTLAFPKGYDGPPLRHARVTLLEPAYGMDAGEGGWETALAVVNDPAPQVPCPTRWDTIVEVVRLDG